MTGLLASMAAPLTGVAAAASPVTPFRIDVSRDTLDWIAERVRKAPLPIHAQGVGATYGVDADWFAGLVAYWRDGFDWRAQELAMNRLPQFATNVGGRRLHLVHQRSTNPAARPLLLLHGWPYSFWTFSEVIGPLSDQFHVVVPSLPGFAFSDPIDDRPCGLRAMSRSIHALMADTLGYDRYFVQGSDFGAVIADWLALDQPGAVLGAQTNILALRHKGAEYGKGTTGLAHPTTAEARFVADEKTVFEKESAYFMLQATRPETIAYAMADSPVGMAAYLLDKWQKWTDTRERSLDQIYGRDRLLSEVMLYVATGAFATSIWPYAGFAQEPFSVPPGRKMEIPYGFSAYPDPLNHPPPRELAAHSRTNIVQWKLRIAAGTSRRWRIQPASSIGSARLRPWRTAAEMRHTCTVLPDDIALAMRDQSRWLLADERAAVQQLVDVLHWGIDSRDWELVRSVLTEDFEEDHVHGINDRETFMENTRSRADEMLEGLRHQFLSSVSLIGDTGDVTLLGYLTVVHFAHAADRELGALPAVTAHGMLRITARCERAGWRIARIVAEQYSIAPEIVPDAADRARWAMTSDERACQTRTR